MIALRTNVCRAPQPLSSRAIRLRRDWAEEEARWEAQLRRAVRIVPQERRAPPPPRVSSKQVLALAEGKQPRDTLLMPHALPLIVGDGPDDLACGKCGKIVAGRTTPDTVRRLYPEGERLLVRCTCKALNIVGDC